MADATEPLLAGVFRKLRLKEPLSDSDLRLFYQSERTVEQESVVLAGLDLRAELASSELEMFRHLYLKHPKVAAFLEGEAAKHLDPKAAIPPEDAYWSELFTSVRFDRPIKREPLKTMLSEILFDHRKDSLTAAWLMTICGVGMSLENTVVLTDVMTESGPRFDYRTAPDLVASRLVRRYPTGALSEKTALILPALIATARREVAVCSPFLVARSLGHTGGTWDKLSSIPGFDFPEPGQESINSLLSCGVAMTVTKGAANPADRKLYQLRSATGTIESTPLIVSSIASKQQTFPVHRLLLDIRIGDGAFLKDEDSGIETGQQIAAIVGRKGIHCNYTLTENVQPNGTAIGNALEVAEAIAVMGGRSDGWDERALEEQKLLVVDFFSKLMAAEFPSKPASAWARFAFERFRSGAVLNSFAEILKSHKVDDSTIKRLLHEPWETLRIAPETATVESKSAGTLRRIDQYKIGEFVNRVLGGGGNLFEGEFDGSAGIVLTARIGDIVRPNDTLCRVYTSRTLSTEKIPELESCFCVSA
jgi:pyrimidine-nucleoside phosphorylase